MEPSATSLKVIEATTDEIRNLADSYIEYGALSEGMRSDALHIATATVAGVDVLASWNFRHMVNYWRIQQYNDEWFPGVEEQQVRAVLEHEAKALRTAVAR